MKSGFSPFVRRSTDSPRQPEARLLRGVCGKLRSKRASYRFLTPGGSGITRRCADVTGCEDSGFTSRRCGGGGGGRRAVGRDGPTIGAFGGDVACFCHCSCGTLGVALASCSQSC